MSLDPAKEAILPWAPVSFISGVSLLSLGHETSGTSLVQVVTGRLETQLGEPYIGKVPLFRQYSCYGDHGLLARHLSLRQPFSLEVVTPLVFVHGAAPSSDAFYSRNAILPLLDSLYCFRDHVIEVCFSDHQFLISKAVPSSCDISFMN